jgi:hypothetical protein
MALTQAGPGVRQSTVSTPGFELFAMERDGYSHATELHVYIGGDGEPWVAGRYAARDPTSSEDPALALFALDSEPAVYLGRPCYYVRSDACTTALWTSARYGSSVIESLGHALQQYVIARDPERLVLAGFSGGGVIALALAPRMQVPTYVITVSTNLDVAAWAQYHGYLPLRDSLDPAVTPALYNGVNQLHLQGERDKNVPPSITDRYTSTLSSKAIRRYPEQDHHCCWADVWPAILEEAPWRNAEYR